MTIVDSTAGLLQEALAQEEEERCPVCSIGLAESETYKRYRVCHGCRFHYSVSAQERIRLIVDPDTFKEKHRRTASLDPLSFAVRQPYKRLLFQAQRATGLREAVVVGTCSIGGIPAVLAVLDFAFLNGSMGCVVGEKIALAFEKARKERLPLVAVVSSAGVRIQEGVLSLVQMAKTTAAAKRFQNSGLPFITVMTNPTTGQVYASFASLADVVLAEPGALIGLPPLRRMAQATGRPLPEHSHTAEFHFQHGLLDGVVDRTRLRAILSILLDLFTSNTVGDKKTEKKPKKLKVKSQHDASPWGMVLLARHEERPSTLFYVNQLVANFIELHGDRLYGDDEVMVCGVGYFHDRAVAIVGQDRSRGSGGGKILPEGFRKAQRIFLLAAKFKLPLLTFIDTPGASEGLEAEERGIGSAIASTLAMLSDLPTPIVSVIVGEGGSEAALALSVADQLLMQENAILSPISPEGAASLLFRDTHKADELAAALRLTARDCKDLDIVDTLVPEPGGGAHQHPAEAARLLDRVLHRRLLKAQEVSLDKLLERRYKKLRDMGEYSSYLRVAISRRLDQIQTYFSQRGKSSERGAGEDKGKGKKRRQNKPTQAP